MKTRNLALVAGIDKEDTEGGTTLVVESVSALGTLKLTWLDKAGNRNGTITNVQAGKKYTPGFEFSGYSFVSGVDADVRLIVGYGDADVGQVVNVTIAEVTIINDGGNPIPVEINSQSLGEVATQEVLADTLDEIAGVAVDDTLTALLAAAGARRAFYVRNEGPNICAIGGADLTYAGACIVIQPGEVWRETIAPGAAWKAICDTGETATLHPLVIT